MKIRFEIDGPILYGTISTAKSRCGKPNCACKSENPKLHGVYYRWTGLINGKRTTITLSKEEAIECQKRIRRYRKLKKQFDNELKKAITRAPWKLR